MAVKLIEQSLAPSEGSDGTADKREEA